MSGSLSQSLDGLTFRDQFNRADTGSIGNGWIDDGTPLIIENNKVHRAGTDDGQSAISRIPTPGMPSQSIIQANVAGRDAGLNDYVLLSRLSNTNPLGSTPHYRHIAVMRGGTDLTLTNEHTIQGLGANTDYTPGFVSGTFYTIRGVIVDRGSAVDVGVAVANGLTGSDDLSQTPVFQVSGTDAAGIQTGGGFGFFVRNQGFIDEFFVCGRNISFNGVPTGSHLVVEGLGAIVSESANIITWNVDYAALPVEVSMSIFSASIEESNFAGGNSVFGGSVFTLEIAPPITTHSLTGVSHGAGVGIASAKVSMSIAGTFHGQASVDADLSFLAIAIASSSAHGQSSAIASLTGHGAEFKIQRGCTVLSGATSTIVLTAGVDYEAPANNDRAFVRLTNGANRGFAATDRLPLTTEFFGNPKWLDLTTDFTLKRTATGGDQVTACWELIEYIGPPNGRHAFVVRHVEEIRIAPNAEAGTSTGSIDAIISPSQLVPFLCGQRPEAATQVNKILTRATYSIQNDKIEIRRGTATNGLGNRATIALVEFIGSAWNIQSISHIGVSTFDTISLDESVVPERTFIHQQATVRDVPTDHRNVGHFVEISSSGDELLWRNLRGAAGHSRTQIYVIENTFTGSASMSVVHIPFTEHDVSPAQPDFYNFTQSYSNPVPTARTSEMSLMAIMAAPSNSLNSVHVAAVNMDATTIGEVHYKVPEGIGNNSINFQTDVVIWPRAITRITDHLQGESIGQASTDSELNKTSRGSGQSHGSSQAYARIGLRQPIFGETHGKTSVEGFAPLKFAHPATAHGHAQAAAFLGIPVVRNTAIAHGQSQAKGISQTTLRPTSNAHGQAQAFATLTEVAEVFVGESHGQAQSIVDRLLRKRNITASTNGESQAFATLTEVPEVFAGAIHGQANVEAFLNVTLRLGVQSIYGQSQANASSQTTLRSIGKSQSPGSVAVALIQTKRLQTTNTAIGQAHVIGVSQTTLRPSSTVYGQGQMYAEVFQNKQLRPAFSNGVAIVYTMLGFKVEFIPAPTPKIVFIAEPVPETVFVRPPLADPNPKMVLISDGTEETVAVT